MTNGFKLKMIRLTQLQLLVLQVRAARLWHNERDAVCDASKVWIVCCAAVRTSASVLQKLFSGVPVWLSRPLFT